MAEYRGEDECCPGEDPDGRGHLSTGPNGGGKQAPILAQSWPSESL
jgi:hypothetical protein